MTDVAVHADGLGKRYRIGEGERYRALRDTLASAVQAPGRILASWATPGARRARPQQRFIWALKDASFEIKQGEAIGIIGRNGAGKSTLLKLLSRITEPTEGSAELHGRVGSLLEVGTGFHPELTGGENIYLNGAILGMRRSEIQRRFDEMVAFAEVEEFIDTPVKHYSSGMYMRLAFSVAAHLEPEILLVDEVLAVGDATFQKKCLGKMSDVARQGRTVLFVSHNMAAIRQLCQTGLLLHRGRVVRHGPVDQVVSEYIGTTATSARCVELAPEDHAGGIGKIAVERVRLVNGVGDTFAIPWLRPIHLALEINVLYPVANASFGLGISTLETVPVLTVHHTDRGEEPVSLAPGRYQVDVWCDNPLRLGLYNVVLGAHETLAKTSLFYVPNNVRLEVVNSADSEEHYFEHNAGIVNGSSRWSVSSLAEGSGVE